MVLIYLAAAVAGILALRLSGASEPFSGAAPGQALQSFPARGIGTDLGAGLSGAWGVLSTQTYRAGDPLPREAAAPPGGALLGAAAVPLIGILSILVGYHMRLRYPDLAPGQAFPRFILEYLSPHWAGLFLSTLLVAILGTGSGWALGFSRIVVNDIYLRSHAPYREGKVSFGASRAVILAALLGSALLSLGNLGSAILSFGFLSMGLRAAVTPGPADCRALPCPAGCVKAGAIGSSASRAWRRLLARAMGGDAFRSALWGNRGRGGGRRRGPHRKPGDDPARPGQGWAAPSLPGRRRP
ncbi:MAG: hypothetical protein M0C28_30295 [Candidatus Moduliflexus flocculans]|nr:hypothetical protein [Candidatus Moduliflexus flocculans]